MNLDLDVPILAAPMAGGATTPQLVRAVSGAGGCGFLAGGYLDAAALAERVEAVGDLGAPFGVNLFVPEDHPVDSTAYAAYRERLLSAAEALGVTLPPEPIGGDDDYPAKLDLLCSRPVPLVSFTFALPRATDVRALQRQGTGVLMSVTTPAEARAAVDVGVDALVVQGAAAGGHSATLDPTRSVAPLTTVELVEAVRAAVGVPIVAAGGVDGPESVRTLLAAGAAAVAVGTLLLRADEAGTSAVHRAALADPRFTETAVTRAFTGRPARALRNGFIEEHDAHAPPGYPALHHLTSGLRRAAAAAGDADSVHLWAGTGWRAARAEPAAEIVRRLLP